MRMVEVVKGQRGKGHDLLVQAGNRCYYLFWLGDGWWEEYASVRFRDEVGAENHFFERLEAELEDYGVGLTAEGT